MHHPVAVFLLHRRHAVFLPSQCLYGRASYKNMSYRIYTTSLFFTASILLCSHGTGLLCKNSSILEGYHWPGDTASLEDISVGSAEECADHCCGFLGCTHWVFTVSEPTPSSNCDAFEPCCWLKGGYILFPSVKNANDTIGILPGSQPDNGTGAALVWANTSTAAGPELDPRFVSVGCETWEWLFDPTALQNTVLINAMKALAPAVLRVGGISADQTLFTPGDIPKDSPWPPIPEGTNLLNTSTFDGLIEFCRATGISLIFDLNEMYGRWDNATNPFNLTGNELLLKHARDTRALYPNGPLFAVELGNELTPRTLSVGMQVKDYVQFNAMMDSVFPNRSSGPKLFGPSTDSCANMTEFLMGVPRQFDAFTYHSYPLSSYGKSLAIALRDPATLQSLAASTSGCVVAAKLANVTYFLTETNSDASTFANAGQNLFINGMWYIASLGTYGLQGNPFHVRWKLWNPRVSYRPGALNQTFGFLDKTLRRAIPEFWIALLHKRLIGGSPALHTGANTSEILVYAHYAKATMTHIPTPGVNPNSSPAVNRSRIVFMLANPQSHAVNVSFADGDTEGEVLTDAALSGMCRAEYILSAQHNVTSADACLNEEQCLTPVQISDDGITPALTPRVVSTSATLRLPPLAYGFVVLPVECD